MEVYANWLTPFPLIVTNDIRSICGDISGTYKFLDGVGSTFLDFENSAICPVR